MTISLSSKPCVLTPPVGIFINTLNFIRDFFFPFYFIAFYCISKLVSLTLSKITFSKFSYLHHPNAV